MAEAAAAHQPVHAQFVGNAFVQQYYNILSTSPSLAHKFYQDTSKLGRPDEDGSMTITTTMDAINEKILSLNYGELKADIKSVDAQDSLDGGIHVLVTGCLTGIDNVVQYFTQSFFLAPQEKGYYVLNDMFRYIENGCHEVVNEFLVEKADSPDTPVEAEPPALQENVISEQTTVLAEEVNGEDANKPSESGEVPVVEEEMTVAEVVKEEIKTVAEVVEKVEQDKLQVVAESNTKVEEVPKKSYASLVMDWKESGVPFSSPPPAVRKSPQKVQVQQVHITPPAASAVEAPVSNSDAVENGSNHEGEGEGYSIYIKGLPLNATSAQLEEEFKQFGPIKSNGIQVRSNRQQGVCFGFVRYEVESAVQKAIEASPITIGGRQAVIEEKRSTNTRGNNRGGRFQGGRGPAGGGGFRNDGVRGGRGNYGGGRGGSYGGRGDFGGRAEFSNRGNNRGGMGGGGGVYQRSDSMGSNSNNGGRYNYRAGVIGGVNGNTKNMPPRVPATA